MRREPPQNVKIENIRARNAMEEAINAWPDRWVLCWNGESTGDSGFDCACCISWYDIQGCGCICHERIGQLDSLMNAVLGGIYRESKCWWRREDVDHREDLSG